MTAIDLLENDVRRLGRLLAAATARSERASWLRAGVAALALAAAIWTGARFNIEAGLIIVAAGTIVFGVAVWYHRRLERWVDTLTIWREMRLDRIARLKLDWEKLRGPAPVNVGDRRGLALDLDLTGPRSLHQLLDTTISREGSQLVADWLVQPAPVLEEIEERQDLIRELVGFSRMRDRFRLSYLRVLEERLETHNLLNWLAIPFPRHIGPWLAGGTVLVAAYLVLLALWYLAGWPLLWVVPLAAYLLLLFYAQFSLGEVFGSLQQVDSDVARFTPMLHFLEGVSFDRRPKLASLCAPFSDSRRSPSKELRRLRLLTIAVGLRSNFLLGLLLNLVLPWDLFTAWLAGRLRSELAESLPEWVRVVHELDALIALANFGALNPSFAFPEITQDAVAVFHAEKLGHPLIAAGQRVTNDFEIRSTGEIEIITGSNMAGKSTFLKTVGINLCLAYTGAPVCAARLVTLPFRLHTCIRITDSIADGFSYFYAEVKCLKRLLERLESETEQPLLYLVDEIFRGTNNRERLVGSRAYVRTALGKNGVGIIATHDLELAGLADAGSRIRNYHFRDQVADGRLVFDYVIRPGPSPTTNALKIMEMEGLPVERAGDSLLTDF